MSGISGFSSGTTRMSARDPTPMMNLDAHPYSEVPGIGGVDEGTRVACNECVHSEGIGVSDSYYLSDEISDGLKRRRGALCRVRTRILGPGRRGATE